jgi:hypothetical protein
MATKATKSGFAIGKALEDWNPNEGKDTVMVFIEEGYYSGGESGGSIMDGLTYSSDDASSIRSIIFTDQTEFTLPPIFNSDTAGFAVIKAGANKVGITFDTPYITEPIVSTTISFEKNDNITDTEAAQFFSENISSIVTNKSQNGFTILLNKVATQDIRFSWIALAVKDAKVFESVMPGLVIENTAPISPSASGTSVVDTTPTRDQTPTGVIPPVVTEPTTTPVTTPTSDSTQAPISETTPTTDVTPTTTEPTSISVITPASDTTSTLSDQTPTSETTTN